MKDSYIVKIKELTTGKVKTREMLLTEKQALNLEQRLDITEGNYKLIHFETIRNEKPNVKNS
jgi:hypothetical protein